MTKQQEVLSKFKDGPVFNFGISKPSKVIPFSFEYEGEEKIQCLKASCGCTDLKLDGNKITGKLSLSSAEQYKSRAYAHVIDAEDRIWRIQGKIAVPVNSSELKPVPAEVLKGKPLPMETKTFSVYFDDGQDFNVIDKNGTLKPNKDKLQVALTIQGYIR